MHPCTVPDSVSSHPRRAGIGIFIINMQAQPPQQIYIKAAMSDSTSVLMAEAAALALAATVTHHFHLQHTNFLSDCQELVSFLTDSDGANPPDWRIKPFTQLFINNTYQRSTGIFKIRRTLNQTADTLARQAIIDSEFHTLQFTSSCSNNAHVIHCPLMAAIRSVAINSVTLLSARCC